MMSAFGRADDPKSDVMYWAKPIANACPDCSSPILLEKTTKRDGTVRYCKNEDCGYKMSVGNTELTSDAPAETGTPAGT